MPANWQRQIELQGEIGKTADNGWIVVFLSSRTLRSVRIQQALEFGIQAGANFVPVKLEVFDEEDLPSSLKALQWFDGTIDRRVAPDRLANLLLERERAGV